ncbi:MAG: hypothetical protein HYU64_07815 [Armatimonadetes bacterium]|nr:hypothetical protein [Armatimonadota bacterium]
MTLQFLLCGLGASILSLAFGAESPLEVSCEAEVSKPAISISETVTLTLRLTFAGKHPGTYRLAPPPFGDFHLLSTSESSRAGQTPEQTRLISTVRYTLKPRRAGNLTIESATLIYMDPSTGNEVRRATPELSVAVSGKDSRPHASARTALVWLLAALLAVYGLVFLRGRKPPPPPKPALKPSLVLSLEERYLRELESLRTRLDAGETEAVATGITALIKDYLQEKWSFRCRELTTTEVISRVHTSTLPPIAAGALSDFLRKSDLVKFAGYRPRPEDWEALFDGARALIHG